VLAFKLKKEVGKTL